MKKLIVFIILTAAMAAILTGCGSTKLADSFDKDKVEASAKQVVEYLNDKDYDSVVSMFPEDLQKVLPSDKLEAAADKTYKDAGEFVEYKNIAILGQKVKSTGEDSAVAVVVAKYKKQNVTFTISLNTNMQLIGLYMK